MGFHYWNLANPYPSKAKGGSQSSSRDTDGSGSYQALTSERSSHVTGNHLVCPPEKLLVHCPLGVQRQIVIETRCYYMKQGHQKKHKRVRVRLAEDREDMDTGSNPEVGLEFDHLGE